MIRSLLRNGFSIDTLIGLCASAFVVFCTLPIHEYAHALVATKLGDDTPRLSGRLTLNPMAHIDIMGAVMILLVGFGYAKAVPVNPRNFKNPKAGMALTAAAGPASNLIMSVIFILLSNISFVIYCKTNDSIVARVAFLFFFYAAMINISLAVFNLIPIPPLDGSHVIITLFGKNIPPNILLNMQCYGYIILVVAVFVCDRLDFSPVGIVSGWLQDGIYGLMKLIFIH